MFAAVAALPAALKYGAVLLIVALLGALGAAGLHIRSLGKDVKALSDANGQLKVAHATTTATLTQLQASHGELRDACKKQAKALAGYVDAADKRVQEAQAAKRGAERQAADDRQKAAWLADVAAREGALAAKAACPAGEALKRVREGMR